MSHQKAHKKEGVWTTVANLAVGAEIAVPAKSEEGGDMVWDEIVSITPKGREQVYDIEVEGTHNFVGNDIFAHNTYLLRADPAAGVVAVGGSLGIGTTTPLSLVSLQGLPGDGRNLFTIASSSGASVFSIDNMGNVGVGTPTPHHTLDVAGDVAAISFINTSTRTMKVDINYVNASTTDDMLSQLLQLKVATYRYTIENQNDPLRLGLIAEDTQTIAPEVLSPDGKGVDIYKLATFTIAGVQALAVKITGFETRLTSLEARVTALESGAVSSASGSPLALGSSTLASALEGFGVLIQKGIAQFNTLVFQRLVAATDSTGASSAGSVTLLAGNTVAQVANSLVLPTTKVFVTFNAQITGSWWVSDKAAGSFRVVLSAPQAADVSFDYFLVQTEGQIATSTPVVQGSLTSSGTGTAPTITMLGANPVHLNVGDAFTDPGVSVSGGAAITTYINGIQQVVSTTTIDTTSPTTYIITYRAMDTAGNTSTAQRSVIVGNPDGTVSTGTTTTTTTSTAATTASTDTTPPVVTLNGAAAMQLTVGDTFTDPGATATDNVDGDLTAKIVETGAVDTATPALYTLTYSATDAAGNTSSVSRVVAVVAAPAAGAASGTTATTTTTSTSSTTTASTTPPTSTATTTP